MEAAGALLEREVEVEVLSARVEAAVGGHGSTVAIEGPAGIGKSTLLAHAVGLARGRGMCVLEGRGGELEHGFAFGAVRQLFERALAAAAPAERERLLGGAAALAAPALSLEARGASGSGDQGAVLHGLYWLAANLAAERPLLLALDDAHWGDLPSLRFVSYLARRVGELSLLVLYAARPGEGAADQLPGASEPELVAALLRPAPLSEPAVAELVE